MSSKREILSGLFGIQNGGTTQSEVSKEYCYPSAYESSTDYTTRTISTLTDIKL